MIARKKDSKKNLSKTDPKKKAVIPTRESPRLHKPVEKILTEQRPKTRVTALSTSGRRKKPK